MNVPHASINVPANANGLRQPHAQYRAAQRVVHTMNMRRMKGSSKILFLFGVVILLVSQIRCESEEESSESSEDTSSVTCGSAIKLRNSGTSHRLHSHQVSYGSGSGQQSVTGFPNIDDPNSLWLVKGPIGKPCSRGSGIKNGEVIRLMHLSTGKYLHSHLHQSPLSRQQEVSCFGDNGGDTGDNWKVHTDSEVWKRAEAVKFQHVDTSKWLSNNKNKFGNPIPGQTEICAIGSLSKETEWFTEEGFYFALKQK